MRHNMMSAVCAAMKGEAMKVVWDIEKKVAIPLTNISCFEIDTTDEWCQKSRDEWNGGRYYVVARYTILTGLSAYVYTSDSREECVKFVELLGCQ